MWGNLTGLRLRLSLLSCNKRPLSRLAQTNRASFACVTCQLAAGYLLDLQALTPQPLTHATVAECKMCLDSDFFDLWRSCGDCNITSAQPQCQLSCEYCLAGEGLDTADHPAPRADQLLAIPAAGCSVGRRDFQVACRPLSEGTCGETWLADIFPTLP